MAWTLRTSGTSQIIRCCAADGNTVIAGVNDGGILRSTDGGATWSPVSHSLGSIQWRGACLATVGHFILVGYLSPSGRIAHSSDSGATWSSVHTVSGKTLDCCVSSGSKVLVAGQDGVLRTALTSDLTTWSSPSLFTFDTIRSLARSTGYFAAGTTGREVHIDADASGSWTRKVFGAGQVFGGGVAAGNQAVLCGNIGQVYYSADDCATWSSTSAGSTRLRAATHDGTNFILGADGGGIYRSADMATWTADSGTGITDDLYAACVSTTYRVLVGEAGVIYTEQLGYPEEPTDTYSATLPVLVGNAQSVAGLSSAGADISTAVWGYQPISISAVHAATMDAIADQSLVGDLSSTALARIKQQAALSADIAIQTRALARAIAVLPVAGGVQSAVATFTWLQIERAAAALADLGISMQAPPAARAVLEMRQSTVGNAYATMLILMEYAPLLRVWVPPAEIEPPEPPTPRAKVPPWLVFRRRLRAPRPPRLVFGPQTQDENIVINSATVVRVSDSAAVRVLSLQMATDWDTYGWSGRLTIADAGSRALLGPLEELEITLNGWQWRGLVDGVASSISVDGNGGVQQVWTASVFCLAYELAAPNAETLNYVQPASPATAQQIALAVLPVGWTLDWQIDDWTVPASTYAKSGTPVAILLDIATAAGAFVQCARTTRTVSILPRYTVPGWDWATEPGGVTVIGRNICLSESDEPDSGSERTQYTQVFVESDKSGGKVYEIRIDGTAGDLEAPGFVHDLITSQEPGVAKGTEVLSGCGGKRMVQWRIPLYPSGTQPGLVDIGGYVQFGTDWRGVSAGTSLAVGISGDNGALTIWQDITAQAVAL